MSNESAMEAGMGYESEDSTPPLIPDHIPQLGADSAMFVEDEIEPTPHPAPTRRNILTTFKTSIAAAVGRHETKIIARDAFGNEINKTLHSQDVTELENKAFAELQLSETKDKWNIKDENLTKWQKFGKRVERFFDRMWRGTTTENLHRVKEYKHGLKLSATAGIEGAISAEFNTEIDRIARAKIEEERKTGWQKAWGKIRDLTSEVFAQERDLHKYKVEATAKLRADYENNPIDPKNPIYHLINRDIAAREEVALRLSQTPLELLRESHGKNSKIESVKLEGVEGKKVESFLKDQILSSVIDDAISRNSDRTAPYRISEKLRVDLDKKLQNYFFSDEFQSWRQTLTPEQQASFENSFTYASDVLAQSEQVLIPSVLDNIDHYQSADRLNFDIELTLGTTQYSANTEAKTENWGTNKERASMNEKIWSQMRRHVSSGNEATYEYRTQSVDQGLRRERILGAIDSIARNEMVAAATGVFAGKALVKGLRAGLGWVPFIGGLVAGGASATKEWGRLNRMRAQYGFEETVGLSHPQAENAKRSEQMRKVDYHRIELGRRVQQLSDMTEKLNTGNYTDTDLLQTLGYLADSKARVTLSDRYGINLLTASKDTPEGRAIYQREVRLHDLARATATSKLKEIIDANGALGQSLGEKIGLLPGTVHQTKEIVSILSQNLEINLASGTQVSTELQVALGNLTISEAESIQARDQAFNKLRWGSSLTRGATTAVVAGLASAGFAQFFGTHGETIASGTNTTEIDVMNHTLPSHVDTIGGIGDITNPVTGEVVTMHAHLPSGTNLVVDQVRVGGPDDMETAYNLVGADHSVLVKGMQFDHAGNLLLTPEVKEALAHNHIEYEAHPLSEVSWTTEAPPTSTSEIDYHGWDNTLHYKDFPNQDIDAYFAKNLNTSYSTNPEIDSSLAPVERVTQVNGLRNFFRGMENWVYKQENFHIDQIEGYNRTLHAEDTMWTEQTGLQEVLSEGQSNTTSILHVPDLLATEEGNRRLAELINESVRENPTGDPNFTFSDEAHRIAWEMSYWGDEAHIPDAKEAYTILEYFNEFPGSTGGPDINHGITPNDAWFTATETITKPVEIPSEDTYTMSPVEWYNALLPTGFYRPLESPKIKVKVEPGPTPAIPSTPYGSSYGYGYQGGTRGSVNNIQIETTEEQRIRQNLPNLLVQAFQQWSTPEADQDHVRGLTWPEQYDWLQNQSRINIATPTQPTPVQTPTNNPITIDSLAAQLGAELTPVVSEPTPIAPPVEAVQTPAIDSDKSSIPELELFIADENDSPVRPEDKAEAIVRMKEFASLGDLDEAVAKNGIKKEAALSMYQQMIKWMKVHKVADIEGDNAGFDKTTYDKIQAFAKSTFWTPNPNPLAVKQLSNALMNLVLEFGSKYHLNDNSSEDANTANMFVLFAAYERVKETKYRD